MYLSGFILLRIHELAFKELVFFVVVAAVLFCDFFFFLHIV